MFTIELHRVSIFDTPSPLLTTGTVTHKSSYSPRLGFSSHSTILFLLTSWFRDRQPKLVRSFPLYGFLIVFVRAFLKGNLSAVDRLQRRVKQTCKRRAVQINFEGYRLSFKKKEIPIQPVLNFLFVVCVNSLCIYRN